MYDLFHNHASGLESPATRLADVTPSDTADSGFATRAIAVGTEGFVQLVTVSGDTGRVYVVPGAPFPIRARRILATGTSATDIVALGMMVQIGVGLGPRVLCAPQMQPAQGLLVVVASGDRSVTVNATDMTIEVLAPSPHAGRYPLALADLARGPACLVAPAIRDLDGTLTVEPGLWAHDAALGAATITRQWLIGGAIVTDATGLPFTSDAGAVPQDIVLAETVHQNGTGTSSLSAPFILPPHVLPEPVPAMLNVKDDATLELALGSAETATVEVIEPQAHAGRHLIAAAPLAAGPSWLAPARIEGGAQIGSRISLACRGLCIGASDAGPVSATGQWQRDGIPIPGAIAETYQVQAADAGGRIGFLETATDRHGTRRQSSNEIAIGGSL